jgi:Acetyltransferase (isoleucine patch superfamily)
MVASEWERGGTNDAPQGGVIVGHPAARRVDRPLALGVDASLRSGTVLYEGATIGQRFETGHNVIVREQTVIGDDVSVWSNTVIDYGCVIGDRVKIHCNGYIAQFTEIEHDAFLAPGVTIANDLYPGRQESARGMAGPLIGAGAQIGINVTILPYVRIGPGAIVGAGSVVTKDIPAGVIAFGNPAVANGYVDDLEDIEERVQVARAGRFAPRVSAIEIGNGGP